MNRRFTAAVATTFGVGILAVLALSVLSMMVFVTGCSTNTDLSGVRVPNGRPDTRITGQPPTLLEASFAIDLNWTGSDPDGRIVGFEWKISNNGTDGISPRDTVTYDPLTGAHLNPWRFTAANDTTFLVLADQEDFPRDEHGEPRSYRTHSVFIRAVDDKGAVDPTPAYISFTATTIVPTCRVVYPDLAPPNFKRVPTTVNVGWVGTDEDYEQNVPTQVRFLWKSAQYDTLPNGDPIYIRTLFEYNQHIDEILDPEDPDWTQWRAYEPLEEDRRAKFTGQPNGEYFIFALQVRDTAGAVSVGRDYQIEVGNFRITEGGFSPEVRLVEPFLGSPTASEVFKEIAGGQPLNFIWSANANAYNGEIASYRHGWDLIDVDDANDPGWAVPPGLSAQNLFAAERSFRDGLHTFTLKVTDDSGQVRLIVWTLNVIPFISRSNQLDLLLIDQIFDQASLTRNWLDQGGNPRNSEDYRNPYWRFLAGGSGGVDGMTWERDFRDHTVNVFYSDVVRYKAVLCFAKYNDLNQLMFAQFRPRAGVDQFVWLAPYQERGGNLFLVGGTSMESFIGPPPSSSWMVPMIFESRQAIFIAGGDTYWTGFGSIELPDGERVLRGPRMYPYATAGIAALDWTSTNTKKIYGRTQWVADDRKADCVGLKAVVLDSLFQINHSIGPGVLADTMFTNPIIDWHDVVDLQVDTLQLANPAYSYTFNNDEFYDTNFVRNEQVALQECDVPEAPGGLCVEPMYRSISRFDWLREVRFSQGENDWPTSRYNDFDLDEACGTRALTGYEGVARSSSKVNNKTCGFMSYKMIADKPVRRADVFWGFDPYRFDEEDSRKAIRWVLQYFGLTINP